jgi:hypothetical protein
LGWGFRGVGDAMGLSFRATPIAASVPIPISLS